MNRSSWMAVFIGLGTIPVEAQPGITTPELLNPCDTLTVGGKPQTVSVKEFDSEVWFRLPPLKDQYETSAAYATRIEKQSRDFEEGLPYAAIAVPIVNGRDFHYDADTQQISYSDPVTGANLGHCLDDSSSFCINLGEEVVSSVEVKSYQVRFNNVSSDFRPYQPIPMAADRAREIIESSRNVYPQYVIVVKPIRPFEKVSHSFSAQGRSITEVTYPVEYKCSFWTFPKQHN